MANHHGEATTHITAEAGQFLLESGFRSDFKIKCQGYEWDVHREILIDRCEYFRCMLNGAWTEAEIGFVDLDDHPEIIQCIVDYIYTDSYTVPSFDGKSVEFCEKAGVSEFDGISKPRNQTWTDRSGVERPIDRNKRKRIRATSRLIFYILLSATADKLGVMIDYNTKKSRLSTLATANCQDHEQDLHNSALYEVLRLLFKFTPSGTNDELRKFFVEQCIQNSAIIQRNAKIKILLEEEEWMAWNIGSNLQASLREAQHNLQNSRLEISELDALNSSIQRRLNKAMYRRRLEELSSDSDEE